MYAQGCACVHDDGEYAFVYAMVHPGARISFPADLSETARAAAPRFPVGEAVGRLAALGADVCQSHMFCALGVTTYRSMLDLLHIPLIGGAVDAMALTMHKGKTRAVVAEAGVPVAEGEVQRAASKDGHTVNADAPSQCWRRGAAACHRSQCPAHPRCVRAARAGAAPRHGADTASAVHPQAVLRGQLDGPRRRASPK